MKKYFLAVVMIFPLPVLAQVASATPAASATPGSSVGAIAAVGILAAITLFIKAHLIFASGSLGAGVIEFLLRVIPSDKPRSLLIIVSAVLHGLADLTKAASDSLDSVLQNTKPKDPPAPPAA